MQVSQSVSSTIAAFKLRTWVLHMTPLHLHLDAEEFAALDGKIAEQEERLNSSIRDTAQKFEKIQEEEFAALAEGLFLEAAFVPELHLLYLSIDSCI